MSSLQRWMSMYKIIDGEIIATMVKTNGNGYYLASEVDTLLTAETARADALRREVEGLTRENSFLTRGSKINAWECKITNQFMSIPEPLLRIGGQE